ncbi:MAG: dihydrolipoyl dehydrogenase [Planctomycetota bacterium]|jgi:dihydrolipoamide dehydrogenase
MSSSNFDVVVIGAGPGGYVAAIRCAQYGLKTAVIEKGNVGGVCLNVGCIPSKALIHIGDLVEELGDASKLGITTGEVSVDMTKVQEWKNSVVERLTGGVAFLLKKNKVELINGHARFTGPNAVEVEAADGSKQTVSAKKFMVATGSRPVELPGLAFDGERIISSTGALALTRKPKKMIVIGGGVIGLEIGIFYRKLGTEVTVVEFLPNILNGVDTELVKVLSREMKKRKMTVLTEAKATGAVKSGDTVTVAVETKKGTQNIEADTVLVAVGVRPNTGDVGLDKAGVKVDDRGNIPVNIHRQTNVPHIYAIGDITGPPWLAHKASAEGLAAAAHIAGKNGAFEPQVIPGVIFTDPEIATVGLSEDEAKAQGRKVKVGKFPFTALGRAITMNKTAGMVKLIADAEDDTILGGGIAGPGASDLIAEITLAIEMGATAEDIALTIHSHPTLAEGIMEAAEDVHGMSPHKA